MKHIVDAPGHYLISPTCEDNWANRNIKQEQRKHFQALLDENSCDVDSRETKSKTVRHKN